MIWLIQQITILALFKSLVIRISDIISIIRISDISNTYMADYSSSDSVAELFAATYKELYTSVSYDNSEMGLLIDTNFQNVLDCGFSEDCIINVL